jgi:hypothetical protein
LVQQSGEKQLPELLVHRFASLNKFVKSWLIIRFTSNLISEKYIYYCQ